MVSDRAPVRVLEPTDVWAHGAVAVGVLACLATAPILEAPDLASRTGVSLATAVSLHAAGGALAALGLLFHAARLCLAWLGGKTPSALLPTPADARELGAALLFGAGLRSSPPAWGRYSYREKVSYLAFAAGLPVGLLSGLAAGHPGAAIGVAGAEGLAALARLHAAAGALLLPFLLWHLFFAQLQPGALFWNGAWLTGKTSWARLERLRPGWARQLSGVPEAEAAPGEVAETRSVEHFLAEGNRAAREGLFAEAEAAYLEALRLYPGYSQALFNLGVARWRAGRGEDAREALERFLEQDPFNPVAARAREILAEIAEEPRG